MDTRSLLPFLIVIALLTGCGGTEPGPGAVHDVSTAPHDTSDTWLDDVMASDTDLPPFDPDVTRDPFDDSAEPTMDTEVSPAEDSGPSAPPLEGDEALDVQELGVVTIDPATGTSAPLSFEAPDDAVSMTITVEGEPGVYYVVEDLIAPDGGVLAPADWYTSPDNPGGHQICVNCENRISASSGAAAVLVPITPSVGVISGTYGFRIASFDVEISNPWTLPDYLPLGGEVTVTVVIKRAIAGLPESGVLNMNLHFTGAGGLTAETAPSDPDMLEALATFETIYAQIGIEIGEITWRDIDPTFAFIDGIMGPGNDFEAAAAQTEGAAPGVNFIFVDEIVDSGNPLGAFGVILGVSGGIPGPVGPQGTTRSAVIVDISVPEAAGEIPYGFTMAHEMGHFLGLFHSSEMPFANLHDPLPDTAQNDTSNLMFFEATGGGTTLTVDQGRVVRGNPWVRHSGGTP